MQLTKSSLVIVILLLTIFISYSLGYNSKEAESRYFWIDNNRVSIDSTVACSPIYNEKLEVIGSWINVDHGTVLIECVDTEDYGWKEFRDSWILAFKKGSKE